MVGSTAAGRSTGASIQRMRNPITASMARHDHSDQDAEEELGRHDVRERQRRGELRRRIPLLLSSKRSPIDRTATNITAITVVITRT